MYNYSSNDTGSDGLAATDQERPLKTKPTPFSAHQSIGYRWWPLFSNRLTTVSGPNSSILSDHTLTHLETNTTNEVHHVAGWTELSW